MLKIDAPRAEVESFCQRHRIVKLSFFGSVTRHDFRSDSDIDVLVKFEPGHAPGFAFFAMQEEVSNFLGRPVELHTPNSLSPHFRDKVIQEADVQYVGT